jgi:hypothetical protein
MGKAASNERIKLQVTFWNNIGVGLILGGVFLPTFVAIQNPTSGPIAELLAGHLTSGSVTTLVGFITTACAAFFCHASALNQVGELQD